MNIFYVNDVMKHPIEIDHVPREAFLFDRQLNKNLLFNFQTFLFSKKHILNYILRPRLLKSLLKTERDIIQV